MIELSELDNDLYKEVCENKIKFSINSEISIIKGDLSGIQNFITDITTEDALKNLRARSLYITLLTDVIAYELVSRLGNGEDSNILLSAGGHFFISSKRMEKNLIDDLECDVNRWMIKNFGGDLGFVIGVGKDFNDVNEDVAKKKYKKFENLIRYSNKNKNEYEQFFKPSVKGDIKKCMTCISIKPVNEISLMKSDNRSIEICNFCKHILNWGKNLPKAKYILMVYGNKNDFEKLNYPTPPMPFDDCNEVRKIFIFGEDRKLFHLGNHDIYLDDFSQNLSNLSLHETRFVINDIEDGFKTLLLGNLAASRQENGQLLSLDDVVTLPENKNTKKEERKGADLIGTLMMDVDGLGKIFRYLDIKEGVRLSCHLDFFFKHLINKYQDKYQNLTLIYSGGDDLAMVGRWDSVIDFACEFRSDFIKWIEKIPIDNVKNVTISAACYIDKPKFPIESSMKLAKVALDEKAKKGEKDAFCLFNVPFKWKDYLENGTEDYKKGIQEIVALLVDMKESNKLSMSTLYKMYKIKNDFKNCAVAFKPRLHYIVARDLNYIDKTDNREAKRFINTFLNLISNTDNWNKLDLIIRYATLKIKEPAGE